MLLGVFSLFYISTGFSQSSVHNSNNKSGIANFTSELSALKTAEEDETLIIDANVGLGRFTLGIGTDYVPTENAISHLKKGGVDKALVYSVLSRETDAEEGNTIIQEESSDHPELIPSVVINPYETDIDEALVQMEKFDIEVVRLFPIVGHYSVYPSIIGPIVEKLQKANKVLFIDFEAGHWSSDNIDYNAVYELCQAYPDIPIVLIGPTITGTRNYPNLLKECDNFYLEISQMFQPEELFRLVKQGYGRRLIFGSDFPLREPASLLNMLAYSGLSQEELRNICSGNLLRLLKVNTKNEGFSLTPPENREIIDLHVHQGKINPVVSGTQNAEDIVRNMDRCGINAGIVTSMWSIHGDVARGNKAVSEACAKYPGRLYGYLTLDPKHPEEIRRQIELYGNNPAFRGIKLHAIHGVDISDPRHDIIFSFANKKGWLLLCHASSDPKKWEKICADYKNANFLIAHVGNSDPRNKQIFELATLAKKCKNLYLDCAGSGMSPGALERLVAVASAKQIAYGSDFPMFDFAYETGRILSSALSESEKDLILYRNAKDLLGL